MSKEWIDDLVKKAIVNFWKVRNGGKGVKTGKTLNFFVEIIEKIVRESGLESAKVYTGKNTSQLPGFFRPHKAWDVVVINGDELIAAIEFKSQVGSIGNNFNNRNEEVLGSSIDLKVAIEESAFGEDATIFTGYLIIVEDGDESRVNPRIDMNFFPVMPGFLADEKNDRQKYNKRKSGKYPRMIGVSYIDRYDLMCRRLMMKGMYTATALITAPNNNHDRGDYGSVSPETSIETFVVKLQGHCATVASIQKQKISGS